MTGILQDLRFAARLLRRSPGFAFGSIVVLALGIAANVTLFGVVDTVLLKPLPFDHPDRLYAIVTSDVKQHFRAAASPPDFLDYRRSVRSLKDVAASQPWNPNVTGEASPERLNALLVSANFFSTLGVSAARGRTFLPAEEVDGRERVAVLSDAFWRRRFGSDPSRVGKPIRLNGEEYIVVGVMPPGFRWGRAYGGSGAADLWAPFALTPSRIAPDQRGNEYLDLIGRLRPGVSVRAAQGEIDQLMEGFRRSYPENFPRGGGLTTTLVPLRDDLVENVRSPLWVLVGSVGFLLAIACTNVAGLLLARAAARRGEIAIRASLGATRQRLLRQLLAESALLAFVAGALGAFLAAVALGVVRRAGFETFPGLERARFDGAAAVFSVGVSALTAVLFGLLPALGDDAWEPQGRDRRGSAGLRWKPGPAAAVSRGLADGVRIAASGRRGSPRLEPFPAAPASIRGSTPTASSPARSRSPPRDTRTGRPARHSRRLSSRACAPSREFGPPARPRFFRSGVR